MRPHQPSQSPSGAPQGQQQPQLPIPQFQQRMAQASPYEQQIPFYPPPPMSVYGNRQQFLQPAMYYYPPPYGPAKSVCSQERGIIPHPPSADPHCESATVQPTESAQAGALGVSPLPPPSAEKDSEKSSRCTQPVAPKVAETLMGDLSGRIPFPIDFHRPPGCFDILQRGQFPRIKFVPNIHP
jgi:hypothetical protein